MREVGQAWHRGDVLTRVAAAFSQAAADYDQYAHIQHVVADDLAVRLADLPRPPGRAVLEIGCGTGLVTRSLIALRPLWLSEYRWVLTDIAPPMLKQSANRLAACPVAVSFVACDAQRPAFHENCFGLIYASLVLQWVADWPTTLARLSACLVPGGVLLLTLFAAGSFDEWHTAREIYGLASTMPSYLDPADLSPLGPVGRHGRLLADHNHRHTYPNALAFLRALRGLGATIPPPGYKPSNAGALRALLRDFSGPFTVTHRVVTVYYQRPVD